MLVMNRTMRMTNLELFKSSRTNNVKTLFVKEINDNENFNGI
jgi:hypothetical protein